jgi:hypothetical protein
MISETPRLRSRTWDWISVHRPSGMYTLRLAIADSRPPRVSRRLLNYRYLNYLMPDAGYLT